MDLGKHVYDVASGYLVWKLNCVKDLMLPLVDEIIQPAYLLPERVPMEAKILRLKIEVVRKATNLKILRL